MLGEIELYRMEDSYNLVKSTWLVGLEVVRFTPRLIADVRRKAKKIKQLEKELAACKLISGKNKRAQNIATEDEFKDRISDAFKETIGEEE